MPRIARIVADYPYYTIQRGNYRYSKEFVKEIDHIF